jgi:hypothetical protein
VRFTLDSIVDSLPGTGDRRFDSIAISIEFPDESIIERDLTLDLFTQDDFGLPDYSALGWKYKGWIVSPHHPYVDTVNITARLTPPAWPYNTAFDELIPGDNGALVSTGTFSQIAAPDDDGNPFAVSDRVPQYPGEDFLDPTALLNQYGVNSINFMPASLSGNIRGAVFITLEPENFVANTNFPLFAFLAPLPSNRLLVTGTSVQITMTNWTQALDQDLRGFPKVGVNLEGF